MPMPRHAVIDGINQTLSQISDLSEDQRWSKVEELKAHFNAQRTALLGRLAPLEAEDPRRMDPKDIQRYREIEIATAYLNDFHSDHPAAHDRVRQAIIGKDSSGGPSVSAQFQLAYERGTPPPRPADQGQIKTNIVAQIPPPKA